MCQALFGMTDINDVRNIVCWSKPFEAEYTSKCICFSFNAADSTFALNLLKSTLGSKMGLTCTRSMEMACR